MERQQVGFSWHLIVIDGGSTDGTLDLVKSRVERRIPTRIIEVNGAPGVHAGLNAGVMATDGPLLLIAERDDVVADGWMESTSPHSGTSWLAGSHMDRFALNHPDVTKNRRAFREEAQFTAPTCAATGMGFRREVWDQLGVFDELNTYGGHDVKFCLRSVSLGHTARIVDEAKVRYRIRSDYARLRSGALRATIGRSFRMPVALRSEVLLGYARGSLRFRSWFL